MVGPGDEVLRCRFDGVLSILPRIAPHLPDAETLFLSPDPTVDGQGAYRCAPRP